ncbi:uncharacterized protein [Venturia canescens]|uniref:uncharacterized protein isoform X2 n=1 Tax=Venturia canescens TaxID=32260 RepID=UPI001C9CA678|nr:uncharacterized protein LOC122415853 isoform X2 [Venturia canescens]
MVISSWLCITLRQRELKKILKMFENLCATLELIGISQSPNKLSRRLMIHAVILNVVWIFLFCFDHAMLVNNKLFRYDIWMPFNFPRIVSHNVVIMFLNSLLIAKKFFHLLNKKIHTIPDVLTSKPILLRKRLQTSEPCGLQSCVVPGPLEVCGQIHSDLVTFTEITVKFFSLSILLVLLVHLVQMAADLYIMCMMIRLQRFWTQTEVIVFAILACWFLLHFSQTVALLGIPDSTANRAGKMLHQMLAYDDTRRYVDTGQILSLRFLQRRLTISLWGLFQMRLSIMHTIIGTVGTYLTVMMQLDGQDIHEKMLNETIVQSLRT